MCFSPSRKLNVVHGCDAFRRWTSYVLSVLTDKCPLFDHPCRDFNCCCNPSGESEIKQLSSTCISRLNICSAIQTPHCTEFLSLAKSSINTANNVEAKLSPRRTPDEKENQSVKYSLKFNSKPYIQ